MDIPFIVIETTRVLMYDISGHSIPETDRFQCWGKMCAWGAHKNARSWEL
jgi:hypothetical protein